VGVSVCGSWDGWVGRYDMTREMNTGQNSWTLVMELPRGTHQFKYIVDGNWMHDSDFASAKDEHGNINNICKV